MGVNGKQNEGGRGGKGFGVICENIGESAGVNRREIEKEGGHMGRRAEGLLHRNIARPVCSP